MQRLPLIATLSCFVGLCFFSASRAAYDGVSELGFVISEIMYQPRSPSNEEIDGGFADPSAFEFIELTNTSGHTLELGTLNVSGSITYTFNPNQDGQDTPSLAPGASLVLAKNPEAFRTRHGPHDRVWGPFTGNLPNDGGKITFMLSSLPEPSALSVRYGTQPPWPQTPRGLGFSLVLRSPEDNPDHNAAAAWRASSAPGGSPTLTDPPNGVLPVYLNEIRPEETILDTYYRETWYPSTPDQAPTEFVRTYVEDMRQEPYHFSFLHLVSPDFIGHSFNWGSPKQDDAIRAVDVDLGVVLDLVDNDPKLKNHTAILLTSDHGGGGLLPYHHRAIDEPLNFTIPFHVWGPGVPAGQDLYALNEETRTRPEESRNPLYSLETATMPIRNGDVGNLALSLLGLPSIPGSWINHDQSLQVGAEDDTIRYVIAISVDGLRPSDIVRLGPENLPNLFRLRQEGAFTDQARTDVSYTLTNPNHTSMITSRGTLDEAGIGIGHRITFNSSGTATLESWGGTYIASVFDVVKQAGQTTAFYSNKAKLDFLGRSFGAIDADLIEVHNPNDVAVNIGGWRLTDDISEPDKFSVPANTVVPPQGYLVLQEDSLWRSPQRPEPTTYYFGSAFSLSPSGGALHLLSATNGSLTGFDHSFEFGPTLHGATVARQPTPDGDRFAMQAASTLTQVNTKPLLSPLVITEVSTVAEAGFVEIRNLASVNVTTSAAAAWQIDGYFHYTIPGGITLASGAYLVLAENPDKLRDLVPPESVVLGPLIRRLSPDSESTISVALSAVDFNLLGLTHRVTLDQVHFSDHHPWTLTPDGHTQERRGHRSFADSPLNWKPSNEIGGTPGRVAHGRFQDWQGAYLEGVDVALQDRHADPDDDDLDNLHEFGFATDPLDPASQSHPIFKFPETIGAPSTLTYTRPLDATDLVYSLQGSNDLESWRTIDNLRAVEVGERVPVGQDLVQVTIQVLDWDGSQFLRLAVDTP